jgi:L-ascorbate metabolism protein UlaG (beta-lactamase superfamily)
MKVLVTPFIGNIGSLVGLLGWAGLLVGQEAPQFTGIQRLTNSEVLLQLKAPVGLYYRIETSTSLPHWNALLTFLSAGASQYTDSAAPYFGARLYRALQLTGTNILSGDHLATDDGDVVMHPINHASFVMGWNGKTIYNDPVGGATPFQGLPRADLILVSHIHTDHFDISTLNAVKGSNAVIIAPQPVFNSLSPTLKSLTIVLTNGATTNLMGLTIDAVPAYNSNHPRGTGNGYVLTIGGKRIYMSGDTGDIPEMRALQDIAVSFVCMNVPFTMSVNQAAAAVRAFRPQVVYPYHYRNQDSSLANLNSFKQQVGTDLGIEVRLRKWY